MKVYIILEFDKDLEFSQIYEVWADMGKAIERYQTLRHTIKDKHYVLYDAPVYGVP